MKFFVTGRSSNLDEVQRVMSEIVKSGHEVTWDWTVLSSAKPYNENSILAGEFATKQIAGIADSDVYILLAHHDGTGVFAELGAALALVQLHGKLKIYGITNEIPEAMFHYHPAIVWKNSIDEVFTELGI